MIKGLMKRLLTLFGIIVIRINKDSFGYNINDDVIKIVRKMVDQGKKPIIFDVGANIGQSITLYKRYFSDAIIHAFEPSSQTFAILKDKTSKYNNIIYNKTGLGAEVGEVIFHINEFSDVSSILEQTSEMWGSVITSQKIMITTIDQYLGEHRIPKIDFLKIDVQGYDFEVLKGAKAAMSDGKITLIQIEITLTELYKNLPAMDQVIKYMLDTDYRLIAFYGFHNKNIVAQWTDCLFIHKSFLT